LGSLFVRKAQSNARQHLFSHHSFFLWKKWGGGGKAVALLCAFLERIIYLLLLLLSVLRCFEAVLSVYLAALLIHALLVLKLQNTLS
jgi:hypothetical protein